MTSGFRGDESLKSCGLSCGDKLAQILVDEDAKLAGKIAAEENERLLGVASVKFCGRRLPRNKGAAEQLIDELERKTQNIACRKSGAAQGLGNPQRSYSPRWKSADAGGRGCDDRQDPEHLCKLGSVTGGDALRRGMLPDTSKTGP
jgi:hypothetical protein